jgi:hypothetical protein
MPKKRKIVKRQWFNSTLIVLLIIFGVAVGVGLWRYGWETVLDESLKYIIGATFTAIVIYLVGYSYKEKIKKWL